MRVSDSNKILFVHNPKTGGASIEAVFDRQVPDVRQPYARHETLSVVLTREPDLADYWIFGFVRNPWDRMVSWWSMIERARVRADAGGEKQIRNFERYPEWQAVRGLDFATFLEVGPEKFDRFGLQQIHLLYAESRRPDFVGRTEDLLAGVNVVRERLGAPAKSSMPHRHKGDRGHYRDYYTPATRDLVAAMFADDIAEFGYQF